MDPALKTTDYFGRLGEVGEYALHVQCDWRILRGNRIVVGSKDLYYPADHDGRGTIPSGFDWERDSNRRDKLLRALFEGDRQFAVHSIEAGIFGRVPDQFDDGLMLEVSPDDSVANEHWRLFRPRTDEPHYVFSGAPTES